MKRLPIILGAGAVLLLLANLVAGFAATDQWADEAARAKCREQGWQDRDFSAMRSHVSRGLFGSTATVEFDTAGRDGARTIRVELRKPLNVQGWEVVGYTEEGKRQ